MLDLFGLESWLAPLVALTTGTLLGLFYGILPGIGGRVGILLSLPMATLFDPHSAAIFLFAMHAVVHTGTSIPAIAFGLPSTASDAATVIDGYPLAKMGRAGEALGASLSASAIGGVLGALAFLACIPIARPLVTSFGPPEFLVLALIGLTMVASLSREGLLPGFVVGCIGILFAMVGYGIRTGEPRFTFGVLDLWDGLDIPALVCGVFVVPEMLSINRHADPDAQRRAVTTTIADVFRGMFVTFRHTAVLLRSTFYGIVIGIMPAVGSSVAVWLSYGYAAQTTKSEIPFGKGAIAGVIAPEAANNSKEGGAMVPTLFFSIPGSSSMAIMMAALGYVGVSTGRSFLTDNIGLSYALAATVLLANILAIPAFFAVVPFLVRLSALRREAVAPIAIALSVTAALISTPRFSTVVQVAVASALGLILKWAGWPRGPFILGFVIGRLGETSFHQTAVIWGWSAIFRPVTALLLVALAGWLIYVVATRPVASLPGSASRTRAVAAGLFAFFVVVIAWSLTLKFAAAAVPLAAAAMGLVCSGLIVVAGRRSAAVDDKSEAMRHVALYAGYLLITPLIGLIASSFVFVAAAMRLNGSRMSPALIAALVLALSELAVLTLVFDVIIEKEIVGRVLWAILGY
ncbi:MAG: tripartite tricarboxylate transporter permease [Bauldia sp.]